MKIGIICPSEIAFRRFMPAIKLFQDVDFVGLGVCTGEERFGKDYKMTNLTDQILKQEREKAEMFIKQFGGKIFEGYHSIVESDEIDAIYIPLPPALHFKWARIALENGKHVMVEKPSTTSLDDTKVLVEIAEMNGLALHENYMFAFHNQLEAIKGILDAGDLGDIRLYRICFGFPRRDSSDFRYNKALGGGALIDAGGYTIKYASMLLGESARIVYAQMNYTDEFDVDLYGSGALINDNGTTVQLAFGMDNNYKCELEVWGSKGSLTTGRVLTAPAGFSPEVIIRKGNLDKVLRLPADDAFKKSIQHFINCVHDSENRKANYAILVKQAELINDFSVNAVN